MVGHAEPEPLWPPSRLSTKAQQSLGQLCHRVSGSRRARLRSTDRPADTAAFFPTNTVSSVAAGVWRILPLSLITFLAVTLYYEYQ